MFNQRDGMLLFNAVDKVLHHTVDGLQHSIPVFIWLHPKWCMMLPNSIDSNKHKHVLSSAHRGAAGCFCHLPSFEMPLDSKCQGSVRFFFRKTGDVCQNGLLCGGLRGVSRQQPITVPLSSQPVGLEGVPKISAWIRFVLGSRDSQEARLVQQHPRGSEEVCA